ncbi:MAG TPA: alpha-glucosidase [Anaerolineaceae bacterium]|nr:alpha-glucosidase [Anaerolineaceae bacterium]
MTTDWTWWRDGVIYNLYSRSFADANADGLGDLQGILHHLDDLQYLGVDALWLTPFYPTADGDYGYDVTDYYSVDPRMGTLEDFDHLLAEAHRRGIRIILDLVLNHTSDQHPWFVEARSSRQSPRHDWYIWADPKPGGKRPNNWQSIVGGSVWEWEPQVGQYYLRTFLPCQPDLNWRNPEVRRELINVFRFWLDRGADGFRLDLFNAYFKDDQLLDNPPAFGIRPFEWQQHVYDCNRPEMIPLLQEIRTLVDSYPDRYLVGETFDPTPEIAARYVGPDRLHATFELNLIMQPWSAPRFWDAIQRWESALGADDWPTVVLNSFDQPRSATRFTRTEDDARLKVAAALLLTLRGTPYLLYGEEIGMRNIALRRSEMLDPIGRKWYPFYHTRDGERSPMQWDDSPNAGFGSVAPWLPVHPNYLQRNVAAQRQDPNSLYQFYRALIQLRRETPALQRGMFQWLTFQPGQLLAYLRQTPEQTVLVALNFRRRKVRLAMGSDLAHRNWRVALSTHPRPETEISQNWLPLAGNQALILVAD